MFDFGDEIIVGNYRIPWLIWIQLLVMFLLIILLYSFSLFALDLSHNSSSMPSSSSSTALFISKDSHKPTTTVTSCLHISRKTLRKLKRLRLEFSQGPKRRETSRQVGENQSIKGEIAANTSKRIVRGEELIERDQGSSIRDVTHLSLSETCYHPCFYIRLAREVFLKCLGLDSTPETSSTKEQSKQD